ncbi:TPA: sigma 54-interacting transcriptional regulator [Escherichia coli]
MAEYKDNLLGEANSFLEVLEQVSHLAPLDKPVLIIGERGTGKELIASRLHYLSSRWQGPFISLNCAALNEIEYGELERVGGSQPLQVNVRLVCATNADLPAMVNEGTFRADLLDRLAFDVVQLPPLRERESDIMLMAEHFAIQMCREIKLPLFPGFTEHARETLLNYRWPGNIRELKNVVERSVYRHGTSDYPLDDIIIDPFKRRPSEEAIAVSENTSLPTLPLDLREFQMQQEKELLQLSLQQGKYNQKRAAELLGLTYHQFRALLKKHQI